MLKGQLVSQCQYADEHCSGIVINRTIAQNQLSKTDKMNKFIAVITSIEIREYILIWVIIAVLAKNHGSDYKAHLIKCVKGLAQINERSRTSTLLQSSGKCTNLTAAVRASVSVYILQHCRPLKRA